MGSKVEPYYEALFQRIPTPVVVVDRQDGVIRVCNQPTLFGVSLEAGHAIYDDLRSYSRPAMLEQLKETITTCTEDTNENILEIELQLDQNTRNVKVTVRKMPEEETLLFFEDITAQKQKDESIHFLEDLLRVFFDEALDIIVLVDEEEHILQINPVVELLLGYRPEELIGKPFSSMLRLGEQEDSDVFTALADYGAVFTALPFLRKDGKTCQMELTATLVPWQQQQAVMITLRDVTHKEELQRELMRIRQEQEKHEHEKALVHARANMIFVIAHQFRTPLTGISMSAQILDRYKSRISPEQYRTHLNRIMGHIDEMDSMIHDMLEARQAFNHGLAFEPAPMSLSEFCKALFDEIAAQYQETHRFQFKDTTSPEYAMLDPSLMKYIVDNLLTNAVKYSPDGGMIAMSVREDGDEFVLTVSDEGIGIPEESYEKIFELFERGTNVEKIQGTGIGLGLVRTCVAQHGGSIEFVSRIGHGTTFTIRLPINRPGKVSKLPEDD